MPIRPPAVFAQKHNWPLPLSPTTITIRHMAKKKRKRKVGRPPKSPTDRLACLVNVRVTKAERARFESEAKKLGVSLSELLMKPWRKRKGKK